MNSFVRRTHIFRAWMISWNGVQPLYPNTGVDKVRLTSRKRPVKKSFQWPEVLVLLITQSII